MIRRDGRLLGDFMLLAALLLATAPGCVVNKGYLVRGDWSLELNRVPFVHGDCEPAAGESCHGHACGGSGYAQSAPPRTRFQPVPTQPVYGPSPPMPETAATPTATEMIAVQPGQLQLAPPMTNVDAKPADVAPPPVEAASAAAQTAAVQPSWIFTPAERAKPTPESVAQRRQLSDQWTAPKVRR